MIEPGTTDVAGPLVGLRVLELGHWVAGPAVGGVLADWGAEVVKVEPSGGDPMRHLFAPSAGAAVNSPAFSAVNRGKLSIELDLADVDHRERFEQLLVESDVLVTNFRPGALIRLGLDPDEVRARHPRLVYCSVTAYGWEGDDREQAGYDLAGFYARAGVLHQLTPVGSSPSPYMNGVGDTFTSMSAVAGVLAAIHKRQATGEGSFVEASLLRTGMWSMAGEISLAANGGRPRPVADRTASPTPLFNTYRAADDRWFVLVGVEADRHLPSVLAAIGHPELRHDERFADARSVRRNCRPFIAVLDGAFATKTLDEWAEVFAEHDVWWAPVQSLSQVAEDPQAVATGAWIELEGDRGRTIDAPIRFDHVTRHVVPDAPDVGSDTDRLLRRLRADTPRSGDEEGNH